MILHIVSRTGRSEKINSIISLSVRYSKNTRDFFKNLPLCYEISKHLELSKIIPIYELFFNWSYINILHALTTKLGIILRFS
jgi:hypothetical protein